MLKVFIIKEASLKCIQGGMGTLPAAAAFNDDFVSGSAEELHHVPRLEGTFQVYWEGLPKGKHYQKKSIYSFIYRINGFHPNVRRRKTFSTTIC